MEKETIIHPSKIDFPLKRIKKSKGFGHEYVCFLDVETLPIRVEKEAVSRGELNNKIHALWFGYYHITRVDDYGRRINFISRNPKYFKTAEEFVKVLENYNVPYFLKSKNKKKSVFKKDLIRVVAHNMEYDLSFIHHALIKAGYKIIYNHRGLEDPYKRPDKGGSLLPFGTGFIKVPIYLVYGGKKGYGDIVFECNMNFWQSPLSALGEMLGKPKKPSPNIIKIVSDLNSDRVFDVEKEKPSEKVKSYCRRDVGILADSYDFISREISEYGVCRGLTISSTTRRIFCGGGFLSDEDEENILCDKKNKRALRVERGSFLGGRVDAFFKGKANGLFFKYDINSAYPFVMTDNLPARRTCSFNGDYFLGNIDFSKHKYSVFLLRCVINVPEKHRYSFLGGPPVKIREGFGNKIIYPTGKYTVWLWQPEYEAYKDWCEIKVLGGYVYKTRPFLQKMMHYFYAKKLKHKGEPLEKFYKLVLNSTYGKFVQSYRPEVFLLPPKYDFDEIYGELSENLRKTSTGESPIYSEEEFEGQDYLVLSYFDTPDSSAHDFVGSYITSYQRARIFKTMAWILDNGGNVYYTDTDSIITDIKLSDDMVDNKELGKWKLEGEAFDIEIIAPKQYAFGGTYIAKGVPNQILEKEKFADLYSYSRPEKMLTSLMNPRHERYGRLMRGEVLWKHELKVLSGKNTKRRELSEKCATFPLAYEEEKFSWKPS